MPDDRSFGPLSSVFCRLSSDMAFSESSAFACRRGESCAFTSGGDRARTGDLLLAKQALSPLSYTPGVASALPAEAPGSALGEAQLRLSPRRFPRKRREWAREDLNLRPHAYQARALTG
jgi:hypothetical protein